jgi:ribosomal protein S27AE
MLHGEAGTESILGDLDEFIASVDHALDGTDGRSSRRRAQVDLLRRVERNVARDRGHVRARHLMTLTHRFGTLASAMREPLQTFLRGYHHDHDVPSAAPAPACPACGSMLVGKGGRYACLDCGSTSGRG